nr:MAG TPA: hypothetical protein [Caudoviricetes sp.]
MLCDNVSYTGLKRIFACGKQTLSYGMLLDSQCLSLHTF